MNLKEIKKLYDFTNKTVVVTGGNGILGRDMVLTLVGCGANVAILDRNRLQIDGFTEDIMSLEPYRDKWEAFGWEVKEMDGHNMEEIVTKLKNTPFKSNKPSLIISNTTKGKGISFMENKAEWHGKALKGDHAKIAKIEASKLLEGFR